MKRKNLFLGLLLILTLLFSLPLQASSLWDPERPSLYEDDKAREEGDLVTVVIMEDSEAAQEADTETEQELGIELNPGAFLSDAFPGLSPSYSDYAGGGGATRRSGTIAAEITAQVIEVKPNGNFKIEGTKGLTVDGETQEIKLSGIIRPEDIGSDNIVESSKLADVDISYTGTGVIADKQRRSIFEWLLNWIF